MISFRVGAKMFFDVWKQYSTGINQSSFLGTRHVHFVCDAYFCDTNVCDILHNANIDHV